MSDARKSSWTPARRLAQAKRMRSYIRKGLIDVHKKRRPRKPRIRVLPAVRGRRGRKANGPLAAAQHYLEQAAEAIGERPAQELTPAEMFATLALRALRQLS